MTHWARAYVGKPWAPDADGPARFSCWGLVRDVFRTQHGVEFQPVEVGVDVPSVENVAAIMKSARASGMRPTEGKPQDGDIVLMRSVTRLHCGVVVAADGRIKVLHSAHEAGVVCDLWTDAVAGMTTELWRSA